MATAHSCKWVNSVFTTVERNNRGFRSTLSDLWMLKIGNSRWITTESRILYVVCSNSKALWDLKIGYSLLNYYGE